MSPKRYFNDEKGGDGDRDEMPAPPCTVSRAELPGEVEKVIAKQQDRQFRWLPVIVTAAIFTLTNISLFAYSYGQFAQRLVPIEDHVRTDTHERAAALFVTRQEFQQRIQQRDREMAEHSAWLTRIEAKLDKALEQRGGRADND